MFLCRSIKHLTNQGMLTCMKRNHHELIRISKREVIVNGLRRDLHQTAITVSYKAFVLDIRKVKEANFIIDNFIALSNDNTLNTMHLSIEGNTRQKQLTATI